MSSTQPRRRPGRPAIDTAIAARDGRSLQLPTTAVSSDLLAAINARAAERGVKRAAIVREVLQDGLAVDLGEVRRTALEAHAASRGVSTSEALRALIDRGLNGDGEQQG